LNFQFGKLHEDEYTTFQILNNAQKIAAINRILHAYMQTSNSIMRREIKQKRIEDNLDAYNKSSNFFAKIDEEIEIKSRRRYLENCIELAGKVYYSNGNEKEEQLLYISNLYKENYDLYINRIQKITINEKEIEILDLLIKAYEEMKISGILIPKYWQQLEKIIQKD